MPKSMPQVAVAAAILVVGFLLGLAIAPGTDELETQVAELESGLEASGAALDAVKGEVEALSAKLEEQAAAPSPEAERLAGLEASVEDLTASMDARVSSLEADVAESAGLDQAVSALRSEIQGVGDKLSGLASGQESLLQQVAEIGETASQTVAMATAAQAGAAAEVQVAAAPASEALPKRPAGLDAPGVHELGVGAAVWVLEKQVSMALSKVLDDSSVRIFANQAPFTLPLGETVPLRGLAAASCSATLKHIEGNKAFVATACDG